MSSNWTSDDLKALEEAIAKGVKSVQYTDRVVTYRSLDEMLQIRDLIRKSLGISGRGGRRVAVHSKGTC